MTGNTSSIRGKANFAGFAPTKAAQRILAESIARDSGTARRARLLCSHRRRDRHAPDARADGGDKPDEFFIKPAAIADELLSSLRSGSIGLVIPHGTAAIPTKTGDLLGDETRSSTGSLLSER